MLLISVLDASQSCVFVFLNTDGKLQPEVGFVSGMNRIVYLIYILMEQ